MYLPTIELQCQLDNCCTTVCLFHEVLVINDPSISLYLLLGSCLYYTYLLYVYLTSVSNVMVSVLMLNLISCYIVFVLGVCSALCPCIVHLECHS